MLDRAHEALRVGIRVRRLKRRLHHTDPGRLSCLRTDALHLPSRSQINTRWPTKAPSSAAVSVRPTWRMNQSLGQGVEPTICTRREARSITNTV
jgi:hypothetical protein